MIVKDVINVNMMTIHNEKTGNEDMVIHVTKKNRTVSSIILVPAGYKCAIQSTTSFKDGTRQVGII